LVDFLLQRQQLLLRDLQGVAVTAGPGLIGALLVGLSTAKALSFAAGVPLVGIHHLEGHILANALHSPLVFPAAVLVVSGGHTEVILMSEVGRYERCGGTVDDAAGEAFDKTAQLMGLAYPGGPELDQRSESGRPGRFHFPRPLARDPRCIFSFSGLKTAVRTAVASLPQPLADQDIADVAYEVQEAITDILVARLFQVAATSSARAVYLAGGVAANRRLRQRTAAEAERHGLHFLPPDPALCTDNAAMVAYAGWCHLEAGRSDGYDLDSFARGVISSWR
jgi:N6-L-threonylcarbamoyladenine synthase